MSYTSFSFLLFAGLTAGIYFLFPLRKYRWTVLLAASCLFYLVAGYRYGAYILTTTVTTYLAGLAMEGMGRRAGLVLAENKANWDRQQKKAFKAQLKARKRRILVLTLVCNLGILGFLKYYPFLSGSLNDVLGGWGIRFSLPTLRLILPLGISFYTFQSIGYVVDVYREKVPAQRNFGKYALFVSFFPQIIQGPISFYDQLTPTLYEPHDFSFTRLKHGCEGMLWGFFKKLVIADRAVIAINAVLENYGGYNGTTLTFVVLLYALHLYADFSGGIDISRGFSQILGIDLAENFRRPYFATTINDYWRRWHITLGAWMKNYVFYPLALSKTFAAAGKAIRATAFGKTSFGAHVAKVLPTSFASLIVFLLVGIWHGASGKYVAFGLWNGGIIMVSTLLEPIMAGWARKLRLNAASFGFRLFQMARTFLIVLVGYVFDVAPSFRDAMDTFRRILTQQHWAEGLRQIGGLGLDGWDYCLLTLCGGILLTVSILQERGGNVTMAVMLDRRPFALRFLVLLTGIMMILLFGIYGPGYDASQFVYMQF